MTLGEFGEPNNHGELLDFIGKDRREIDSVILFHIMQLGKETTNGLITAGAWKLSDWKRFTVWVQKLADPALNAHCLTYLESHDQVSVLLCQQSCASAYLEIRLAVFRALRTTRLSTGWRRPRCSRPTSSRSLAPSSSTRARRLAVSYAHTATTHGSCSP